MTWIVDHIQILLVVFGLATSSMLLVAVAPSTAQRLMFGEAAQGPIADVMVRGWGLLIALTGGMMLWAAAHPETRTLAIGATLISKLFFMGQMVAGGRRFLKGLSGLALVLDLGMAAALAAWMWAEHGG